MNECQFYVLVHDLVVKEIDSECAGGCFKVTDDHNIEVRL